MGYEGRYRTFVTLDPYERWILRVLQAGLTQKGRRKPPAGRVVGTVLREYWEDFERNANPELLAKLKSRIPPPT